MEKETLQKIDQSLDSIIAGQKDAREKIEALEKEHGEVAAKLLAVDDKLRSADAWRQEVEEKFAKGRFGQSGSDHLLAALPEETKAWIPRVAGLRAGQVIGLADDGEPLQRSIGMARLAQKDPVLYVATGFFFQCQIKAAMSAKKGRSEDAQKWAEKGDKIAEALGGFDPKARVALQEDTANEGAELVPTIVEAVIGWLMKEASVVRGAGATVLQMEAKTHQLPSLANDFTVSWTSEEGLISDAAPAAPFSQGALTANKQTGLVTVSIELIQDNVINLMDFVMMHLLQQAGRAEDAQALEGSGSPFTGLFSVSGVNSVAGGSDDLSEPELRKLIFGGEHATTIENGVIFSHPWIVRDALGLTTGSGGSIWLPYMISGAVRNRPNVHGVPVHMTSSILRNRGTGTNETTAYHGDPRYIVIGDRMGTSFDVNPWSEAEFKRGQVLLRLIRRIGIVIWVPAYFTKLTAVTVAA